MATDYLKAKRLVDNLIAPVVTRPELIERCGESGAAIRRGRFDASVFAADLGEVMAGRGAMDYRDAAAFFGKTYLTKGLAVELRR